MSLGDLEEVSRRTGRPAAQLLRGSPRAAGAGTRRGVGTRRRGGRSLLAMRVVRESWHEIRRFSSRRETVRGRPDGVARCDIGARRSRAGRIRPRDGWRPRQLVPRRASRRAGCYLVRRGPSAARAAGMRAPRHAALSRDQARCVSARLATREPRDSGSAARGSPRHPDAARADLRQPPPSRARWRSRPPSEASTDESSEARWRLRLPADRARASGCALDRPARPRAPSRRGACSDEDATSAPTAAIAIRLAERAIALFTPEAMPAFARPRRRAPSPSAARP